MSDEAKNQNLEPGVSAFEAIEIFALRIIKLIETTGPTIRREDGSSEVGPWVETDIIDLIRREARINPFT